MSIFTKMPTLSTDPVIAYFRVVRYKKLSNDFENLSGLIIWGLEIDYAINVNLISIACNDLWRVFLESGTHFWWLKSHEFNKFSKRKQRSAWKTASRSNEYKLHSSNLEKNPFSIFITNLWIVIYIQKFLNK